MVVSSWTWAQQSAPPAFRFNDLFEVRTRDPDQPLVTGPRTCRLFELGEYREAGLRINELNDFISGNDIGRTTDHGAQIETVWDWALVALRYKAALNAGLTTDAQGNERTPFREVMDVNLSYVSRPFTNGLYYRTELGYQSFGDTQEGFGARAMQDFTHRSFNWGDRRNYQYGDLREQSMTANLGLGYFGETDTRGLYCRGECDAIFNTEWDRSLLRLTGEVGVTILEQAPRRPLLETVLFAQCGVYPSGETDTLVSPITLRGTIDVSQNTSFQLLLGVNKQVDQNSDMFLYTDYDWLLHADLGFVVRF